MISQTFTSRAVSRTPRFEDQFDLTRAVIYEAVGQREQVRLGTISPYVSLTVAPSNPSVVGVRPTSGSGSVEWTIRLRDANGSVGLFDLARLSEVPTSDLTAVCETCLTEVVTLSRAEETQSHGSDP